MPADVVQAQVDSQGLPVTSAVQCVWLLQLALWSDLTQQPLDAVYIRSELDPAQPAAARQKL